MLDLQTKHRISQGDPTAFKEVFRLLYPRLRGYCKLFIASNSEVEDIIQESFITLWEKRKSIDFSKSIESFLFVIVRNKCLNILKSRKLEEKNIEIDNINRIVDIQYLYQLDLTEEEGISQEEILVQLLHEAIDELPKKMKEVFVMCKIEKYKQQEVADKLGISLKMVEKHIAKAKMQIRKRINNHLE
jgi:RNA polymerase sigma-70 factor (ECF subfamily)